MSEGLKWPGTQNCDLCGEETADLVFTLTGAVCWKCHDGRMQADADRAYDYARDREMWEGE